MRRLIKRVLKFATQAKSDLISRFLKLCTFSNVAYATTSNMWNFHFKNSISYRSDSRVVTCTIYVHLYILTG
jgi:hypothetical protein